MEGGFVPEVFLERNRSLMKSPADILSLAMMLESQALDLYVRFAGYMDDEKNRRLLQQIADDEKAHLRALGEMIEKGHH
jgi:rubrerythrin